MIEVQATASNAAAEQIKSQRQSGDDKPKAENGTAAQECTTGICEGCDELTPAEREKLIATASSWEGTPYAPAASSAFKGSNATKGPDGGADCSGSVWAIYTEAGFPYPYSQTSMFPSLVTRGIFVEVSASEVKAGDIIYWAKSDTDPGHVIIYVSGADASMEGWGARSTGKNFSMCKARWFDRSRTRQFYKFCKNKK